VATALSRIAGLVREVVARAYFGTQGPASAFTFAFQLPEPHPVAVRRRRAVGRLRAVFTELLEEDRRKDAATLAGHAAGLRRRGARRHHRPVHPRRGRARAVRAELTTFDAALTT
jgi:hypothetical protein